MITARPSSAHLLPGALAALARVASKQRALDAQTSEALATAEQAKTHQQRTAAQLRLQVTARAEHALARALATGDLDAIRAALDAKTLDVDDPRPLLVEGGRKANALAIACDHAQVDAVRLLLERLRRPALALLERSTGECPLEVVARKGSLDLTRCVVEYFAEPSHRQRLCLRAAASLATTCGHDDVAMVFHTAATAKSPPSTSTATDTEARLRSELEKARDQIALLESELAERSRSGSTVTSSAGSVRSDTDDAPPASPSPPPVSPSAAGAGGPDAAPSAVSQPASQRPAPVASATEAFLDACEQGDLEAVRHAVLHDRIDPATAADSEGCTGLLMACVTGQRSVVEFLLSVGAPVEGGASTAPRMWSPLIAAAYNGHVDLVRVLLAAHADPWHSDDRGYSARTWAFERGFSEIADLVRAAREARDAVASPTPPRGAPPQPTSLPPAPSLPVTPTMPSNSAPATQFQSMLPPTHFGYSFAAHAAPPYPPAAQSFPYPSAAPFPVLGLPPVDVMFQMIASSAAAPSAVTASPPPSFVYPPAASVPPFGSPSFISATPQSVAPLAATPVVAVVLSPNNKPS